MHETTVRHSFLHRWSLRLRYARRTVQKSHSTLDVGTKPKAGIEYAPQLDIEDSRERKGDSQGYYEGALACLQQKIPRFLVLQRNDL